LPPARHQAALERQAAREQVLADAGHWVLSGRVALTNDGRGGSGRIEWEQRGDAATVSLSAPITRQSWRLEAEPGAARLEGLDGGPRSGTDPAALLRAATGWEIPVVSLSSWVRGARDPAAGAATLAFGDDGRLARMDQAGWRLAFGEWAMQPALGIELPGRIEAERGAARVRLVVDAWAQVPQP
jgi:outer membrane lipoprotein LolB